MAIAILAILIARVEQLKSRLYTIVLTIIRIPSLDEISETL